MCIYTKWILRIFLTLWALIILDMNIYYKWNMRWMFRMNEVQIACDQR